MLFATQEGLALGPNLAFELPSASRGSHQNTTTLLPCGPDNVTTGRAESPTALLMDVGL